MSIGMMESQVLLARSNGNLHTLVSLIVAWHEYLEPLSRNNKVAFEEPVLKVNILVL